jgi:hypothetical protein
MKKEKINLAILYLCVHKKANERCHPYTRMIFRKDFENMLGSIYHVPKKLRGLVIREMEKMNMIKVLGYRRQNKIQVLPIFSDPEENLDEFYRQLGFW